MILETLNYILRKNKSAVKRNYAKKIKTKQKPNMTDLNY